MVNLFGLVLTKRKTLTVAHNQAYARGVQFGTIQGVSLAIKSTIKYTDPLIDTEDGFVRRKKWQDIKDNNFGFVKNGSKPDRQN